MHKSAKCAVLCKVLRKRKSPGNACKINAFNIIKALKKMHKKIGVTGFEPYTERLYKRVCGCILLIHY